MLIEAVNYRLDAVVALHNFDQKIYFWIKYSHKSVLMQFITTVIHELNNYHDIITNAYKIRRKE